MEAWILARFWNGSGILLECVFVIVILIIIIILSRLAYLSLAVGISCSHQLVAGLLLILFSLPPVSLACFLRCTIPQHVRVFPSIISSPFPHFFLLSLFFFPEWKIKRVSLSPSFWWCCFWLTVAGCGCVVFLFGFWNFESWMKNKKMKHETGEWAAGWVGANGALCCATYMWNVKWNCKSGSYWVGGYVET